MRPHKLLMKAFGPFAKETVVDFDAMGNSIYLICGDTGSGKTTIFDGIIYALYGTASGGARSGLGTEAFHSDYAKDGSHREEMQVTFSFSNAGRDFTVVRRMYWGRRGDSRTVSKESTLSENGNVIVFGRGREDRDDVTSKVTEILGLDADQFRRIIMLAQGEFQQFLTAKSDERGVILGKLYDNRQYQDFQLRLKAAASLLKEQDSFAVEAAKAQLRVFILPENLGEDERAAIAVDHPELLSTMHHVLEKIDSELVHLTKSIKEEDACQKSLEAQKTQGETCNSMIESLASKKTQLYELEGRKDKIASLQKLVTRAEFAEKVLPFENSLIQSDSEWSSILDKIRTLDEQRVQLEKRAATLLDVFETTEKTNTPLISELRNSIAAIQGVLHFYEDLSSSLETFAGMSKALKKADENVQKAREDLKQHKEYQAELSEELKRLEPAGEVAVTVAKNKVDDLSKRKTALEEFKKAIGGVQTLIEEEASLAKVLQEACNREVAAESEHLRLNKAFIQGQAGLLAQDMRDRLLTEPEVVCPVCGAVHTDADIPLFAALHDNIPSKDMVEDAYALWEKARQAAKEADEKHTSKENALSGEKQALLSKSEELLSVSKWEALESGSALAEAIAACEDQISTANNDYDKAVKDQKAKEKAVADKAQIDKTVEIAENALSEAITAQNDARNNASIAETSVANWRQQLQGFPENKDDAQGLIDSLSKQAEILQKQIDDAKEAYSKCLRAQAENDGNLTGANSEKDTRKKAREQAAEVFSSQLRRWSFADPDAYHMALSPEGVLLNQDELTAWVSEKKEEIDSYEHAKRDLESAIKQLDESTKGMNRVDVDSIQEQIAKISVALERKRAREKELAAKAQTDHAVYNELSAIQERRRNYRKISTKLNPLAETADGRYAFSRYVLSGFFHRIVEQANIHLETMTDGEYCLVPKETGDGRSNIGLELKVMNTITNLERDTATLSGGQLFEASLSLALGLSDVVQMESTSSIQIDSMFIDEGFGSLDGGRLDKSIEVLQHLSAGKRQIGIISHVARLDECLPKKIHVIAGDRGSSVRIETDV